MNMSILSPSLQVQITPPTEPFSSGPYNIFAYVIIQGFFTVLAMKEFVSVLRYCFKGTSSALDVNAVIEWHMVENWEDLFKIACQLFFPRRMHSFASEAYPKRAPLTRLGWTRFIKTGFIALIIFSVDMGLIVLSVPNRASLNADDIAQITWDNSLDIPDITKIPLLRGSFSRVINVLSPAHDIEFSRLPSVSLERTDFRDFGLPIPKFNGKLMHCSAKEEWRIVCRIHCQNRYYQYKLRLDVPTESSSLFFVPTTNITVVRGKNVMEKYAAAITSQLKIPVNFTCNAQERTFTITTRKIPMENTTLPGNKTVLTNDAIATIFMSTIVVKTAPASWNMTYFERKQDKREEIRAVVSGQVATSQRAFLPLYGSLIIYVVLQLISIVQQKGLRLHSQTPELVALVEIADGPCAENIANVNVGLLPVLYTVRRSKSVQKLGLSDTYENGTHPNARPPDHYQVEEVGHIGYTPGNLIDEHRDFLRRLKAPGGGEREGVRDREYVETLRRLTDAYVPVDDSRLVP